MITLQIGCAIPLPCGCGGMGGIAFDGGGFVSLHTNHRDICRLDRELNLLSTVTAAQKYTGICYDRESSGYWVCAETDGGGLYRLDAGFQETDRLTLSGCRRRPCGVSCDPCGGGLWLLYPDAVEHIDKTTGGCIRRIPCERGRINLEILALCGGYMVAYLENGKPHVAVECTACSAAAEICIPKGYYLKGMALCGVQEVEPGCTRNEVRLLLANGCHWSAMDCVILCCPAGHPCPPIPPCPPVPPCPPPCPPIPPCPPPCPPPWPPMPPCPPCTDLCCGANMVIHSIALEEAGIAHILNAEGEKLQKAVVVAKSVQELLCVNESVKQTITQITQLEGQLYAKLEAVTAECGCKLCGCGGKDCPPRN